MKSYLRPRFLGAGLACDSATSTPSFSASASDSRAAGGASTPKSNEAFWQAKFARIVERDRSSTAKLQADGWRVLTVWECEAKDREGLAATLRGFLDPA